MDILLDMDDVICEFTGLLVKYWNEDHPEHPRTLQDIKTWLIEESLPEGGHDFVRSVMRYNHLYKYMQPIEGAVDGVKALIDDGHDVMIVTTVPKAAQNAYDGKLQWIRDWMPFFNLDNVITAKKKYRVTGDLLLDDAVHNLMPFEKTGNIAMCFDRPNNQDWMGPRVYGWNDFVQFVRVFDTEGNLKRSGAW